ncbi:MAG: NAD(P)/FAD-dependent oxidoreductase [Bacteroidetes bacterium]|nr:NAD(P)/FAD-dependent oxidoreductase [Bacteroidota bacterium]
MKKLIIIGGGFAGLRLARELRNRNFEIWLFDKNNYHQFQPLFYQVATCGLDSSSISFPLRKVFQGYKNVHIRNAEVQRVDSVAQTIQTNIGVFTYDYLVIATGATTNFFGSEEIEKNSIPMKSTSEALYLRNRLLQNFEDALSDKENLQAYLNIVVVGGGATGVEVSGSLAEMKKHILPKDYPEIDFSKMNIYLVEAGPKTLSAMSANASAKSQHYLEKLGVHVYTGTSVKNYDGRTVVLSTGKNIESRILIWAAGIRGNTISGIPPELILPGNRIAVDEFNRMKGSRTIFVLGDIACMQSSAYPKGHPQVATVAIAQARHLAKNLKKGEETMQPFIYKDKGSMATVGRNLAVVDLPFIKFGGWLAWLFWMFLHLMLVLSVKNKVLIFVNWVWKYFTFDQSLRLIVKPFRKN